MRWFPFLGFVNSDDDPELRNYLELDITRQWKIFIFEWFDFTFAFFAMAAKENET